jgi:CHASE2 domain-containing sensor protein/signal transduction histidine kinase
LRLRLFFEWCAILAMALGVTAVLVVSNASDRVDNVLYDGLVSLAAPPVSDRILLVKIDDTSIAQLGHWPFSRDVHARLLEQLAAARPAAIAYDVLFTEATTAEADQHLSQAMRASGNVALPVLVVAPGSNGHAMDAFPPLEPIASAARAIGEVDLILDSEGVGRSVPLSLAAGGRDWTHLMEATYRIANGHASPVFRRLASMGTSAVDIPFQPSGGGFHMISFASIVAGEVPPQFIRDKIVLVGIDAAGLGDRLRVPTRGYALMSGVEVQANLLNGLLADRIITVPGMAVRMVTALIPTLTLLASFWYLRPSRAFTVSIVTIGLILIVPPVLLLFFQMWLAPVPALVGVLLAYPLWSWRRLQAIDRTIGEELDAFSGDDAPLPLPAAGQAFLDPIGGQTMRLHLAIAAMRDVRRLVSDTIDSVNDPILVTDLDDRVILANIAASASFGAVLDNARSAPMLEQLAGQRVRFDDDEPSEIRLDNEKVYSPRRLSLRNHAGEQRGWIVHLVDISAIRLAQREREDTLEFLSHDMRSPQSSIITLLEQHRQSITDGAVAERIKSLAQKTLRLSDDFVQMARFSAASFDADEVNLADILTEAADELWPLASRRNVRIAVEGAEDAFYMLGERDALSRALTNLIDNAVKFSPEGATVQCSVRSADDGMIECLIEDEGPGIQAERRKDLFARYGARDSAGGSRMSAGLGLAFVGAAVKRHGGSILCEPREPRGTRFVLRFMASE